MSVVLTCWRITTALANMYGNAGQIGEFPNVREHPTLKLVARTCSEMLPMVASSLIKNCLPFIHQCIQRALDFREIPIRHPSIDLCGFWACMPEQHLDISQVRPAFKQVCRKGMP